MEAEKIIRYELTKEGTFKKTVFYGVPYNDKAYRLYYDKELNMPKGYLKKTDLFDTERDTLGNKRVIWVTYMEDDKRVIQIFRDGLLYRMQEYKEQEEILKDKIRKVEKILADILPVIRE